MSVRWITAFVDLYAPSADEAVAFWVAVTGYRLSAWRGAALTGWERRPGGLPEFDSLVRPAGMPLRLFLQCRSRTGGSNPAAPGT